MKIYLSGKMTGEPDMGRAKFAEAAKRLRDGLLVEVFSPAELPDGMSPALYMRLDFAMIDAADIVMMLPGWDHSKGARLERDYAIYTGKPICYYRPSCAELMDIIHRCSYGGAKR